MSRLRALVWLSITLICFPSPHFKKQPRATPGWRAVAKAEWFRTTTVLTSRSWVYSGDWSRKPLHKDSRIAERGCNSLSSHSFTWKAPPAPSLSPPTPTQTKHQFRCLWGYQLKMAGCVKWKDLTCNFFFINCNKLAFTNVLSRKDKQK